MKRIPASKLLCILSACGFATAVAAATPPATGAANAAQTAQAAADSANRAAVAAAARQSVDARVQANLDAELKKVRDAYENARKELQEEYAAIRQERDDATDEIFKKVGLLKEKRLAERDVRVENRRRMEEGAGAPQVPQKDREFIENVRRDRRQGREADQAYESALSTLQQMYRLVDRRYHDKMRIHRGREALEEARYRDQRDYAEDKIRLTARRDGGQASEARMKSLDLRIKDLEDRKEQAERSYRNSGNALDKTLALVEKRADDLRSYLEKREAILENIAKNADDTEAINKYSAQLQDLDAGKTADERIYQAGLRSLEEELALEQMHANDLASLATFRRGAERRQMRQDQRLQERLAGVAQRLSSDTLTPEQKAKLEAEKKTLDERIAAMSKAYDQAIKLADQRKDLLEKAHAERIAYLHDREAIRARMAKAEASPEALREFRNQISQLEDKRMTEERAIRDQLTQLGTALPVDYRPETLDAEDSSTLRERSLARFDAIKDRMDKTWKEMEANYDKRIAEAKESLSNAGLGDAGKQAAQERIKDMEARKEAGKRQYDNAVQVMAERRKQAESLVNLRVNYMGERQKLMEGIENNQAGYEDVKRYEDQLRQLDAKYDAQIRDMRGRMKPLGAIIPPAATDDRGDRLDSEWEKGVREAARSAEYRHSTGEVQADQRGVFSKVGDAIVSGYHDVVDYFTD